MVNNCESCGMPIKKGKYCKYCSDKDGNLKSREEVREGWIGFTIKSEGLTREEAEKKVDSAMAQMPAWK